MTSLATVFAALSGLGNKPDATLEAAERLVNAANQRQKLARYSSRGPR